MEKFEKLTAVAAPMPASNIDTDIIMPKAFLKAYSMISAFTKTEPSGKNLY